MTRKSKKDEKVGSDGLLGAQILSLVLIQLLPPPPFSKVYLMPVKTERAAWLRDLVKRILQALERCSRGYI